MDPQTNETRTPAQVVSYISIVTSTGSIIIGLLLIRQYRVKPRETIDEAVGTGLILCAIRFGAQPYVTGKVPSFAITCN